MVMLKFPDGTSLDQDCTVEEARRRFRFADVWEGNTLHHAGGILWTLRGIEVVIRVHLGVRRLVSIGVEHEPSGYKASDALDAVHTPIDLDAMAPGAFREYLRARLEPLVRDVLHVVGPPERSLMAAHYAANNVEFALARFP